MLPRRHRNFRRRPNLSRTEGELILWRCRSDFEASSPDSRRFWSKRFSLPREFDCFALPGVMRNRQRPINQGNMFPARRRMEILFVSNASATIRRETQSGPRPRFTGSKSGIIAGWLAGNLSERRLRIDLDLLFGVIGGLVGGWFFGARSIAFQLDPLYRLPLLVPSSWSGSPTRSVPLTNVARLL